MDEHRKCPKCGGDLKLVEDKNHTIVGGVPDTSTLKVWQCPKCGYSKRQD